ncbi:hypothetical protein F4782DRAFT_533955 [Xylaria castorea]|nr:hypothetical protein F4782DRAFT_533955 [Xylaria castorea]
MALLAELILAAKEGSIVAATHFMIKWLVSGWVLANEQFLCLVSGYSLFFYVLNVCFAVSRQAPAISFPNSWLVCFSRFASGVFEPILNLRAMHMFAPWIPTTWSSSYILPRFIQSYSIISWIFDSGLSMPRHMLNSGISFIAQPHMMHRAHQVITTAAAAWFIIRHITAFLFNSSTHTISNENPSTHELYLNGSNEQQHIYWAAREIATNCTTHWRKHFTWGCHLEESAPLEQMQKLEFLLDVKLPHDYKTFLQLTNGLNNVLDGGKPHLTFLPADSPHFALSSIYQEPSDEMRRLYVTWLVESLFGPGSRAELIEQTGHYGGGGQCSIKLIKIASRDNESGGVFLVSPEDVRYTVQDWVKVALYHRKRNGALIGKINNHVESYFGNIGLRLGMLKDWREWLVLQVQEQEQHNARVTRCRLYPGFTAFLQTLAEITRRSTAFLMTGSIGEHHYANHCRWQWEWEWDRKLGGEIRLIGGCE